MERFVIKRPRSLEIDKVSNGNNNNDEECHETPPETDAKSKPSKQNYNRKFNANWEKDFFVVEQNGKSVCLLCRTESEHRKFNIERHFKVKHSEVNDKFPLDSEKRESEIKRLKNGFHSEQKVVKRFLTQNQLATMASYVVAFQLAKGGKPYVDGEFYKNLMCSTVIRL